MKMLDKNERHSQHNRVTLLQRPLEELSVLTYAHEANNRIRFVRQIQNDYIDFSIGKMEINVTVIVAARIIQWMWPISRRYFAVLSKLFDGCL